MKKSVLSLALITIFSLSSCKKETPTENTETTTENTTTEVGVSGKYNVDTTFSIIDWVGSKPAGKHTGTIAIKEGNFEITDGKITNGSFIIDMTSITVTDLTEETGKTDLETHLKGTGEKEGEDHFFNTSKFPTSSFKINSVSETDGKFTVNGTLTMKDIAKEISFPAAISINENEVSLISDSFKIDRTLWGVNYASKSIFDDLKDKFVNDEIELTIKVKATK
ncbi:YceI family protein [Flavobacterium jejuense]|uniref:YceI family protein n=1 Tax=Flavobacterium jejuense TaxID=1544455 RepID=A0ABX0IQK9_9FLAO|nr:YceI family protein [Flavobacterium jejuense]NHN25084.1 YceI family protein [Flavobacterium jejuense]